jgi:6-phosphogluconolactonase/glucosamine-6-phosphate isomerase/deaminase
MVALKTPTAMQEDLVWSPVERTFLERSGHKGSYSNERVPTIEVTNIYELGKIVSLRFLEWVQTHPTGVVALPTGRTPEFFIKTLERYKTQWHTPEVQAEVRQLGFVGGADFPDTTQLRFVMLDEFFPMHSTHRNSFCRYIRTYYLPLLGVRNENVLTFDLVSEGVITAEQMNLFNHPVVDIDLLHRAANNGAEKEMKEVLHKVAAYCDAYEARVVSLGGIGFFLGGIGPDGHIAFNQQGGPLDSTTRLVRFNYPSAAQAAGDLGGIEISRGKAAITIGLKTITANPDATIIIMAAGEGKAKIVRGALEEPRDPERPASALHGHRGARFYISHGAACQLTARKALRMANTSTERAVQWALSHSAGLTYPGGSQASLSSSPPADYLLLESYLFEQSVRLNIPVHQLNPAALASTHTSIGCPSALLDPLTCCALVACAAKRLREKVEAGLNASEITNKSIVHTGPHHDDVELSYHGAMHAMLGRTEPYGTNADITLAPWPTSTLEDQPKVLPSMPAPSATHVLGEARSGNVNHFAYLTSGFHSVNESYLQQQCEAVTRMVATATGMPFSVISIAPS